MSVKNQSPSSGKRMGHEESNIIVIDNICQEVTNCKSTNNKNNITPHPTVVDISKLSREEIGKITEQRMIDGYNELEKGKQKNQSQKQVQGKIKESDVIKALFAYEDGDAALFVNLFRDKYVYDHAAGRGSRWHYWNDHFWRVDKIDQVTASISDVIGEYWIVKEREDWKAVLAERNQKTDEAEKCKAKVKLLNARIKILHTLPCQISARLMRLPLRFLVELWMN